jgi:predicted transcriptional regulator
MKPEKLTSLNNGMIEILMECHERELLNHTLLNDATKYIKYLYLRGLVDRRVNGNGDAGYFITEEGKKYLEDISG